MYVNGSVLLPLKKIEIETHMQILMIYLSMWRNGFILLHVVVSFSLGTVLEAVVCIQVYCTALYRRHGSTDLKSKTMHEITLCIICNALYTTGQSAVAHWTLGSQSLGIFHDATLQVSCQSFCLIRPLTSLTILKQANLVS